MRILHTSDWHLGQYFYGKSRANEHQQFMAWLLETIKQHQVQLLIVAGDIFDTGTPPSYARALYNQFIVDMQQTGCELLILGGNHDSVSTLGESQALLAYLNTHVVPGGFATPEQHVIELSHNGVSTQPYAIVCALPFLRARELVSSEAGESATDKQQKLSLAIAQFYQQCFEHAQRRNAALSQPVPIIATGHLTTVGASSSDSVREIYIGSLDAFNAAHFPPADYIALGHIHRMQVVAKSDHIRYSGSPIPLSFDELPRNESGAKSLESGKQVLLVEFEQQAASSEANTSKSKLRSVTPLSVPLFQPMHSLKGNLQTIEQALSAFADSANVNDGVNDSANASANELVTWLSIEVSEQDYLTDLQARIAALVKDKHVEVLQLTRTRKSSQRQGMAADNETLAEINVEDVFARRLALEVFETQAEQAQCERVTLSFKRIAEQVKQSLTVEHPNSEPEGAATKHELTKHELTKHELKKPELTKHELDTNDATAKEPTT